jgi:hypothetical protein
MPYKVSLAPLKGFIRLIGQSKGYKLANQI